MWIQYAYLNCCSRKMRPKYNFHFFHRDLTLFNVLWHFFRHFQRIVSRSLRKSMLIILPKQQLYKNSILNMWIKSTYFYRCSRELRLKINFHLFPRFLPVFDKRRSMAVRTSVVFLTSTYGVTSLRHIRWPLLHLADFFSTKSYGNLLNYGTFGNCARVKMLRLTWRFWHFRDLWDANMELRYRHFGKIQRRLNSGFISLEIGINIHMIILT